jgi:ABC-type glycerol-3-phosphate transport system substrate-binding protein
MLGLGLASGSALGGCRQRVVERVVEKEITKVVTKVVRETVIVEKTLAAPPRTTPPALAPRSRTPVVADVLNYSWAQFAMLMTPTFEEMFPSIRMFWRTLSDWRSYPQRIAALRASDQLGDLVECPPGTLLAQWARQGLTQPLDEIIQAEGFDTQSVFRSALQAGSHQGALHGLCFISHAGENLLLYRSDLIEAADLAPPQATWTLDDLQRAALALTRDRHGDGKPDQFGYSNASDLPSAYPLLHLFGASLLSADGRRATLENEAGRACLRWLQQQVQSHRYAPSPAQMEGGAWSMFLAGKAAMVRSSFRVFVETSRSAGRRLPLGATLFPRLSSSGHAAAMLGGMAYAISQRSNAAREAFQWIKFMSSREMGVQLFLGGYADPGCRPASWDDPRVVELFPLSSAIATTLQDAPLPHLPANLREADCLAAWNERIGGLLAGEATPEQIAAEIGSAVQRALNQPPTGA